MHLCVDGTNCSVLIKEISSFHGCVLIEGFHYKGVLLVCLPG